MQLGVFKLYLGGPLGCFTLTCVSQLYKTPVIDLDLYFVLRSCNILVCGWSRDSSLIYLQKEVMLACTKLLCKPNQGMVSGNEQGIFSFAKQQQLLSKANLAVKRFQKFC